jgi:hypothetical protein
MASTWITRRATNYGAARYRVEFRVGGRESKTRYGGSFRTMREARSRRDYVAGELAALRVPDLHSGSAVSETLKQAAGRWKKSRVDVAAGTLTTYTVALGRLLPRLGDTSVEAIDAQMVADLVGELHAAGLKKATIRKTIGVLGMILDHAGRSTDNPARDRMIVKMPREARHQVQPPTADHVEAVVRLLPSRYATSKTGRPRWVTPPPFLYERVLELCARDDRHPDRRVFEGVTGDRLRTALTRACTAAGVPAFSPHDLRLRRVSLMHLAGVPWARIGEQVGHDDLVTTARTYTHVVADERELDYPRLLGSGKAESGSGIARREALGR